MGREEGTSETATARARPHAAPYSATSEVQGDRRLRILPQSVPGAVAFCAARAALMAAIRTAFLFGPGGGSYTRSLTGRPPAMCSSRMRRAFSGVTPAYQTFSG